MHRTAGVRAAVSCSQRGLVAVDHQRAGLVAPRLQEITSETGVIGFSVAVVRGQTILPSISFLTVAHLAPHLSPTVSKAARSAQTAGWSGAQQEGGRESGFAFAVYGFGFKQLRKSQTYVCEFDFHGVALLLEI